MMIRTWLIAACGLCASFCSTTLAQAPQPSKPQPAAGAATRPSTPTSTPTSTSAPARHVVVIPPGFKAITVDSHTAIIEPADEAWVRATLSSIGPTTLPSTMPSTQLEKLTAQRAALKAQIVKDLALPDPAVVDKFFKEGLETQLNRYDEIAPPLFYMIITRARLLELVKGGWSDPRFYYNRAADDIQLTPAVNLATEGQGDDVLVPIIVDPDEPTDKRRARFVDTVHQIEGQLAAKISQHSQLNTRIAFIGFMANNVLEPLKPKPDQEWFGVGFTGVLSARYASRLIGVDASQLIQDTSGDWAGNPIRPDTIDLIHPTPLADIRPAAIPYYADAYRRKSTRVVSSWMLRAGDDALPKVLAAMRKDPPADGAALIKLIQQTSGIDLTNDVKSR